MMRSLSEINRVIKNVPFKLREWLLKPIGRRLIEQEAMLHILSNANLITRAMLNQSTNKPINVLFVCHEPTLWPMFESVYHAMLNDAKFSPLVVALPYRHGTLPKGQYKNAGIFEFCESLKIRAIRGYDKRTNEWQDPAVLMPDYVFFQTPYDIFPRLWSAERISMMARVCYIPYGTVLFRGAVDDAVSV